MCPGLKIIRGTSSIHFNNKIKLLLKFLGLFGFHWTITNPTVLNDVTVDPFELEFKFACTNTPLFHTSRCATAPAPVGAQVTPTGFLLSPTG